VEGFIFYNQAAFNAFACKFNEDVSKMHGTPSCHGCLLAGKPSNNGKPEVGATTTPPIGLVFRKQL
jgi:hypothetical protein